MQPTRSHCRSTWFMQLPASRFPSPQWVDGSEFMYNKYQFSPGANTAGVNIFKADLTSLMMFQPCPHYTSFVKQHQGVVPEPNWTSLQES